MTRVLVVGLDGLDAGLVEKWLPELPSLRRLVDEGISGPLRSIVQPVTPAAWTAMTCGGNPGHFGFTDFFYRPEGGYGPYRLVHSGAVRAPRLEERVAAAGRIPIMIGVPVSYPPVAVSGGISVSCFMAPDGSRRLTVPPELQSELEIATRAPYQVDVRVDQPGLGQEALAERLLALDAQRFDAARHLLCTRDWDLLFFVCMGTDRVAHSFLRYLDPEHVRHQAGSAYGETIQRHYAYCDSRLGELMDEAGPDVAVLVVSDHGVQRLDGKVYLNRWLRARGDLVLENDPAPGTSLRDADVDWARTRAWASGYGGQIFFNLESREPLGTVRRDDCDQLGTELAEGLRDLRGPDGCPLTVTVHQSRNLFDGPYVDRCPDLCVQFDELRYLASDRVDAGPIIARVGTEGLDDASHAMNGFLALAGSGVPSLGRFTSLRLVDVAPTILDLLGVDGSALEGEVLHRVEESPYAEDDRLELTTRLRSLYLE